MSEYPPGFTAALYASVGQLVVSWAFVEQSLDMWIATIYPTGGREHIDQEIPQALKRKIRFLRLCAKQLSALAPVAKEMGGLLTRAADLSNTRHYVVHGAFIGYTEQGHVLSFRRLDRDSTKTSHEANTLRISAAKLLDQGGECRRLAGEMTRFGHRLADVLLPEDKPH